MDAQDIRFQRSINLNYIEDAVKRHFDFDKDKLLNQLFIQRLGRDLWNSYISMEMCMLCLQVACFEVEKDEYFGKMAKAVQVGLIDSYTMGSFHFTRMFWVI